MNLGDKILKLRKKQGLSQEELGDRIKVTRQTISNWELGETNPNPEQLKLLSKELQVSIDELLDNDVNNILVEKVSKTEVVTNKSFLLLKIIAIVIGCILAIFILLVILKIIVKNTRDYGPKRNESIHCKIYGEEHGFVVNFYEYTGVPLEIGGDSYFFDILDLDKYNDVHQIFNIVNDYVKKNGGVCTISYDKDLSDIVDISIKENTLSKTGVTVIITEKDDYDLQYDESFWLEKYDYSNNKYIRLKENSNCGFNSPAYFVTLDKPLELKQDWSCMYGELDKGLYRIVKETSFESDNPPSENDIYNIWTEFEIE